MVYSPLLPPGAPLFAGATTVPAPRGAGVFWADDYGGVPDGRRVHDGIVAPDGSAVSSATANWSPSEVGKLISVSKNGLVDGNSSWIGTVVSPTTVLLQNALGLRSELWGQSGCLVIWGHDNAEAFAIAGQKAEAWPEGIVAYGGGNWVMGYGGQNAYDDGWCFQIPSGVTLWGPGRAGWLMPGTMKGPVYSADRHDIAMRYVSIYAGPFNVGGWKFVNCINQSIEYCNAWNAPIASDLIDPHGALVAGCQFWIDDDVTADRRGDTNPLSVRSRNWIVNHCDDVQMIGNRAWITGTVRWTTGLRVIADPPGATTPAGVCRGIQVSDFVASGLTNGASFERGDNTAGDVEVQADGLAFTDCAGAGVQYLRARGTQLSHVRVKDPTFAAVLGFGASDNVIDGLLVDGQKAGWGAVEWRDLDGVGSRRNVVRGYRDRNPVSTIAWNSNIGPLSEQNQLEGIATGSVIMKLSDRRLGTRTKLAVSETAPDIADSTTIVAVPGIDVIRYTPAGARTDLRLGYDNSTHDGDRLAIWNVSENPATTMVFAAGGTSNIWYSATMTVGSGELATFTFRRYGGFPITGYWHRVEQDSGGA